MRHDFSVRRFSVSSLCLLVARPPCVYKKSLAVMNHLSFLSFSPTFFFSASLSFHGQGRKFPVGLAEPRSPGGAVRAVMDGVLITASSTLERPWGGGRNPSRSILTQHARAVRLNELHRAHPAPNKALRSSFFETYANCGSLITTKCSGASKEKYACGETG